MQGTSRADADHAPDPEVEAMESDIRALREAAEARERAVPGTPEWQASLRHEEAVIARIREWIYGERHGS